MRANIAVIGCGDWGKNHIATLHSLGVLKGVYDLDSSRSCVFAKKYGVDALTLKEIYEDPSIKGVVIALPAQFHSDHIMAAVQNGKDVFVEKPLALDLPSAQAAIEEAQKYDKILMVGHLLRYHPAFEKLHQLVQEGAVEDLRYIYAHRLGFGKFHEVSDALWDLGPHDISMIITLINALPDMIHGEHISLINHLSDLSHLHMNFPNNIAGHLFVSRLSPYQERKLVLIGKESMLVFDDLEDWDKKIARYGYKAQQEDDFWNIVKDEKPTYFPVKAALPLTRELEHFLKVIETREQPRTDGRNAYEILKILDMASKGSLI